MTEHVKKKKENVNLTGDIFAESPFFNLIGKKKKMMEILFSSLLLFF